MVAVVWSIPAPRVIGDSNELFILCHVLGANSLQLSRFPLSLPSTMPPTEVDPSTLSPKYLSKASKKGLIKYFGDLQGMYAERERKYSEQRYPTP